MFLRERRVWAAETLVLLLRGLVKEGNVGRRSEDGSCGSELAVQVGYLDSGGLISGGCGREDISPIFVESDRRSGNTSQR